MRKKVTCPADSKTLTGTKVTATRFEGLSDVIWEPSVETVDTRLGIRRKDTGAATTPRTTPEESGALPFPVMPV
jgi:hypothetical protein